MPEHSKAIYCEKRPKICQKGQPALIIIGGSHRKKSSTDPWSHLTMSSDDIQECSYSCPQSSQIFSKVAKIRRRKTFSSPLWKYDNAMDWIEKYVKFDQKDRKTNKFWWRSSSYDYSKREDSMIMNIETESFLSLSLANLPPLNEVDRIMILIFLVWLQGYRTWVYILHLFIKIKFCPPRPKVENLKDSNVTSSTLKLFSPPFYYNFSYNKKQPNVS